MTRPNFQNENSGRSFPFTLASRNTLPGPTTLDKLPNSAIVDFGAVMGVTSAFVEGTDQVVLDRVTRDGGKFYFYFKSTSAATSGYWLVFTRDVGDRDYITEYAEASETAPATEESISLSVTEQSAPAALCDVSPLWSGYLITGDLSDLETLVADGQSKYQDDLVVEPALIKNQYDTFVRSINIANADL